MPLAHPLPPVSGRQLQPRSVLSEQVDQMHKAVAVGRYMFCSSCISLLHSPLNPTALLSVVHLVMCTTQSLSSQRTVHF